MLQVYPDHADLGDAALAARYAYPGPATAGQVWLRANMVSSLDGAATAAGRSGGLSGEADRQVFALLRALADVVLVGAGTVRAEGYRPARATAGPRWAWLREGRPPAPPIAVVTRALDLDTGTPLFTGAPPYARTIVVTTGSAPAGRRAAAARTADVIVAGDDGVDLATALDELASRGHRRILCEGGPHLLAQLAGAGLVDELCLTLSPVLAGPGAGRIVAGGPPPVGGAPQPFALAHALADEEYLLCRYVRRGGRVRP